MSDVAVRPKVGEVVRVVWLDASGEDGWLNGEEIADISLRPIESVGFLARHDTEVTVIASCWDVETKRLNGVGVIPSLNVQSLTLL